MPLSANECLVILTGGTPEGVVAGIAAGFKTVVYVASDDNEELIHKQSTTYLHPNLPNFNSNPVYIARVYGQK